MSGKVTLYLALTIIGGIASWLAWANRVVLAEKHADAAASIVGLLVGIVGFTVAILQLFEVKRSTEAAAQAVQQVKFRMQSFDDASLCDTVRGIIAEIDRMHVTATTSADYASHVYLPERYRALRDALIELRARISITLTHEDKILFQASISKLADFERSVAQGLKYERYPRLDSLIKSLQKISEFLVPISLQLHERAVDQNDNR